MRQALWVLLVLLVPVCGWSTAAAQKPNPQLLNRALDEYLKGDHDAAMKKVMLSGFSVMDAQRWVNAGNRASQERRRMAAATAALEYVKIRFYLIPQLLTWARPLVAGTPGPTATENLWLRASVAVSEGYAAGWSFLTTGRAPGQPAGRAEAQPPVSHLAYVTQRFPDDPYFKMASAVAAEHVTSPIPTTLGATRFDHGAPGFDHFGADLSDTLALRNSGEMRSLERAAATLEDLVDHEVLGIEAHLRLGYVRLRLGQGDSALQHFDKVTTSDASPAFRYMGHLFAGLALSRVNRASEAAASYRAALRLVPRARSATTLLTALLLVHGQAPEAELVATEFISGPGGPADPLERYFVSDFAQFDSLVRRLREAIR